MGHLLRGRSPWSASLARANIMGQHLSMPGTRYSMRHPGIQAAAVRVATALPAIISTESPTRPQNSPIARFNWEHTFSTTMTNHMTLGYLNRNEGYGSEPQILDAAKAGTLPLVAGAAGNNSLPQFTFTT